MEVTHINNNRNGEFDAAHRRRSEFDAAHSRRRNLKRHIAARRNKSKILFIPDRFTFLSRSPTFKKVGI